MDSYPAKYMQLLRDPCAGPIVGAPYAGTDAGYLIRTTDNLQITCTGAGLVAGTTYACSAFFQYAPNNFGFTTPSNSVAVGAGFAPGGVDPPTMTWASQTAGAWSSGYAFLNYMNNAAVKRCRAVAACVKWIPTGPYSSRQGLVASSYIPATPVVNTENVLLYSSLQAAQQHMAPNGAELHEVRWLPTAADETWVNPGVAAATPGCGSIQFVLRGVDGTGASATTAILNGYFEVTTVWEWIPTETQGVVVNPRVPMPYTTQGILSTIKDLGEFLYGSSEHSGTYAGASRAVRGAARAGAQLLSNGVRAITTKAVPMLLGM